ncbi:transmembrane and coiled-coil domain protein 3-like isoform X2 [Clarias gariepinus]|nr:transmembrane and coiled-coil domain protein 3-like isoform X2 [Clarias gariepinus]XP_053362587.1 transmembrane and coiled-coil domain protein 3-like isoform X2 [Clarias gariepinus]XP_053362588.1 transmembrane and coiled-coil domain protein 3-like isoform X2 [Clarias gariepinus]XP_053362589.1 transmembrane and coiled-coil domain protein 3-like isoform X2 [Clarias gariepinus]
MDNDGYVLSIPVPMLQRGVSDSNLYSLKDLEQKILKAKEQLRVERIEQDDNVAEFLKLVNIADKQQVARIRHVFEKKNQKTTQNINQLQKKLEQYYKRMKESENNNNNIGSSKNSSPKDAAKDQVSKVSPSLERLKPSAPMVLLTPPSFFNKPREFANLIRNKFGSADNIAQLKTSLEEGGGRVLSGSTSLVSQSKFRSGIDDDQFSMGTTASEDSNGNPEVQKYDQNDINMVLGELQEIRQSQIQLAEDMEVLKVNLSEDDTFLTQRLEEERDRMERLEEQLNDLVELHQHEMANLKQELASIEEKVAYQANERARDLQEVLDSCNSRLCKLEQQVQVVQVETEGVFSRNLLVKIINVLLAVVTLLLVCVSTVTRCIMTGVRSRYHLVGAVLGAVLIALVWRSNERLNTNKEMHQTNTGL